MRTHPWLPALALLVAPICPVSAQVPHLLGYQGRLLRGDGTAATGTATVAFGIYGSESGGTPLWSETQTLGLSEGYYSTFLGLVTPPPEALFEGQRWLEVKVGTETLAPRQSVGAVSFAFTAQSVSGGAAKVTSVQVSGATVIDSAGRLAGSARYSAGAGLAIDDATQTVSLGACAAGQVMQHDGTTWGCSTAAVGSVTSVGASAPLSVVDASTTPYLSLSQAGTGSSGFLSSTDWAAFNSKYGALTQCGGDLSGALSAPTVARLQSRPVSATAPTAGQVLKWTGTQWEPATDANSGGTVTRVTAVAPLTAWNGTLTPQLSIGPAGADADGYLASADWARFDAKYDAATQCGGDLDGSLPNPRVKGIQGIPVVTSAPGEAQVLRFDGTSWAPASLGIADVGGLSSGYVDLDADQTLGGVKTFTSAPVFEAPLSVSSGGTGRSASFDAGSVVFAGSGGAFSQSAGLRWDESAGRLAVAGSGTALGVQGNAALAGNLLVSGDVNAQRLCDASGANCRDISSGWNPKIVTLTDAPVIQVDADLGTVFQVTLGGNRTLGNPTGGVDGQAYTVRIRQDSAGGRSLTWGSKYRFSGNSIPASTPGALSVAAFTFDGTDFLNTGGYNLSGIVPFNFTNASGVGVSEVQVSNSVSLAGISGAVLASITGPGSPALSVNGGSWTTTASVTAGDTLKVRATSSPNVVTTTSELIVVGGYTTSWSITTTTNPSAFSFTNVMGSAWNTVVESGAATPTGYTGALPISVTGEGSPELSVDGGAWVGTGTGASIAPGQTLALRLASAGSAATTRSCTLTMGSYSTTWSVATTPNPGAFAFTDISTGVAWNTVATAAPVTPVGHTGPLVVSVTGTGGPQISIDGGNWGESGVIAPGQTLSVRLTSANAPAAARSATVTVGSHQTTWTVTSSPNPGTFSFADLSTGVAWNTVTPATAVTPTGFNGPLAVGVSGQGSPEVSIAGGTWSNQAGVITPGQTLAVRLTSANAPATAYSATVTVGSYQTTWTATTTPNPTAFNFANVSGVSWNTQTTAAVLTPTGYNGPLKVKVEGSAGAPEISVAGGNWTAAGTWLTISPTQNLNVRMTSAGSSNAGRPATITMGTFTTTWTLTTTTDPTAFSFTNIADAVISSTATATALTPSGFNAALPVSVASGSGNPQISVAGGAWTGAGTTLSISPGQTLQIRQTAPGTIGSYYDATVTLGGYSTTWRATAGAYYGFGSHTFTTCGQSGQSGPAQSSCQSSYSSASWAGNTSYFTVSGGIQQWKVPVSGSYRIEAWGARGGNNSSSQNGGWGARMRGDFTLTAGQTLKVLVGQSGTDNSTQAGGGGGTFVTDSSGSALIVAGGGGGGYSSCNGNQHGTTSTTARTGTNCSAASGGGGGPGYDAGGGGGLTGNGSCTRCYSCPSGTCYGYSFSNGGSGGNQYGGSVGGFGGGGGSNTGANAGGGGGGYSGGSGGYCNSSYSTPNCGLGGGSYNGGSSTSNSSGEDAGASPSNPHGQVVITKL